MLLATFLLTIFRDLTEGILVGFALGAVLFINRMAEMTGIEADAPLVADDKADDGNGERTPYFRARGRSRRRGVSHLRRVLLWRGSTVGAVLDSIADTHKAFVVDFAAVPFLDSTAANAMSRVAAKARRQGIRLFITGASPPVRRALLTHGVRPPRAKFRETIARAVADIKSESDESLLRRMALPQDNAAFTRHFCGRLVSAMDEIKMSLKLKRLIRGSTADASRTARFESNSTARPFVVAHVTVDPERQGAAASSQPKSGLSLWNGSGNAARGLDRLIELFTADGREAVFRLAQPRSRHGCGARLAEGAGIFPSRWTGYPTLCRKVIRRSSSEPIWKSGKWARPRSARPRQLGETLWPEYARPPAGRTSFITWRSTAPARSPSPRSASLKTSDT